VVKIHLICHFKLLIFGTAGLFGVFFEQLRIPVTAKFSERQFLMKHSEVYGIPTRGWLLKKFAMGTRNYWFAFIADSSSALFFLAWEFLVRPNAILFNILAVVLGYASWTLTEYIFHRWIYHQVKGIFVDGHTIHHNDSQVLIAMPWAMTTVTVFALWHFISQVYSVPYFSGALSGWLGGYVYYSLVHHSHHHWNIKTTWFRKLKAYHRIHHQFPEYNFGVTMRSWDMIFGTNYRKPKNLPTFSANESNLSYDQRTTTSIQHEEPELALKS